MSDGKMNNKKLEDFLRSIDQNQPLNEEMDDFDKDAMEGLRLVKDRDRLFSLNSRIDEVLEQANKSGIETTSSRKLYYFIGMAASLALLVGLFFLMNPNQEKLAQSSEKSEVAPEHDLAKGINSDGILGESKADKNELESGKNSFQKQKEKSIEEEVSSRISEGKGDFQEPPSPPAEKNVSDGDKKLPVEQKPIIQSQGGAGNIQQSGQVFENTKKEERDRENKNIGFSDNKEKALDDIVIANTSTMPAGVNKDNVIEESKTKSATPVKSAYPKVESEKKSNSGKTRLKRSEAPAPGTYKSQETVVAADELSQSESTIVEANYPGGLEAANAYIRKEWKGGNVASHYSTTVKLSISAKGKITSVSIIRGLEEKSSEAKQLISILKEMKNWNPSVKNGAKIDSELEITLDLPLAY